MSKALTHLERLESEDIHIIREVVAETEKPVMLYSISSEVFYPARRVCSQA